MSNSLSFFRVDGAWRDAEQPLPSSAGSITPQVDDVSGYVDFFPGTEKEALSGGLSLYVSDYETYGDTELVIAPITARMMNAYLCSITVGDPKGVDLVDNSAWMDFGEPMFYHVRYRNITYSGELQRFSNFAFQVPGDGSPILLTSPALTRFAYAGP